MVFDKYVNNSISKIFIYNLSKNYKIWQNSEIGCWKVSANLEVS